MIYIHTFSRIMRSIILHTRLDSPFYKVTRTHPPSTQRTCAHPSKTNNQDFSKTELRHHPVFNNYPPKYLLSLPLSHTLSSLSHICSLIQQKLPLFLKPTKSFPKSISIGIPTYLPTYLPTYPTLPYPNPTLTSRLSLDQTL